MHYKSTYSQAPSRLACLDIETIAPPTPHGAFPPWPTHLPVVASVLTADQVDYGEWAFSITSVGFDDEKAGIEQIDQLLAGRRCLTFNGRGFDLPVLALTAMRSGAIDSCRNLTDAWASNRVSGSHIDLADIVAGYGSAPRTSLKLLCEALGIPVKTNGNGSDVGEMLRVHGRRAVELYCEEDTGGTLLAFALVQGFRSNDQAYTASLIGDFADWVEAEGLAHLDGLRALARDTERERVRLLHRVDEGLRALEGRITEDYFEQQRRLTQGGAPITAF